MRNYTIRIYHHVKNGLRRPVGVVEEVGVPGRKPFCNLDELCFILNPPKAEIAKPNKPNKLHKLKKSHHQLRNAQKVKRSNAVGRGVHR